MTSFESNEIHAVEVDGVLFETIVSQTLLTIPEPKRGAYTSVQVGVRITNRTHKSLYFSSNFYSMFPEMIAPDGQLMRTGIHCERWNRPMESEFVLLIPGGTITLCRDAFLFWIQNRKKKRDRKLTLNIPFPCEDLYAFRALYPGTYQFRFDYGVSPEIIKDLSGGIESISLQTIETIAENLWTGKILTPLVDIQLVPSAAE